MFNLLHNFEPSSVLVNISIFSIHWYGLLMTLAVVAGFLIARRFFAKYYIDSEHVFNLGFYLIIFGFIGARIYHVINEPVYYWQHPLSIFAIWNGGLALHGAILAGVLVIFWYVKKHPELLFRVCGNIPVVNRILFLTDIAAPALAIGQAIGRWGNYFNQELYGIACNYHWCIPIALENRVPGFKSSAHFHPTFLYESVLNLVIFGVLLCLHKRQIKNLQPTAPDIADGEVKGGRATYHLQPGIITAIYLVLYSLVRISMELFRIDRTPVILGIRLPILFSVFLIIAGIIIIVYTYKQKHNTQGI